MDRDRLITLLADYQHRALPPEYSVLSPAAEVAALLKEHAAERAAWERELQARERGWVELTAAITGIAFLLDGATARFQEPLEAAGLRKIYRELRVLKGQLVQVLSDDGFTWEDPSGRPFEDPLVDRVHVDGWRYADGYAAPCVAEVREAIILRHGALVREGSIIVGAPHEEFQMYPDSSL
jgi:hypothetical protein